MIELTSIPALGTSLHLEGIVHGDAERARIAVYIRVHERWWTKPYWDSPTTSLASDGSFSVDITTGGRDDEASDIAVFLTAADYQPPVLRGEAELPAELIGKALARADVSHDGAVYRTECPSPSWSSSHRTTMKGGVGRPSRQSSIPDQFEWPIRLSILAYGVRVGVRANDQRIADAIADHFPPGAERLEFSDSGRVYSLVTDEETAAGDLRCSAYVDGTPLAERVALPALLDAFEASLQLHVAEMAPERVFVHAGVVAYRGRAIVLPGRTFSGKTTLVAELVRAGAEYYSDEYAVLDAAGAVYPYPRPLAIRRVGIPGAIRCPVDALGGRAGSEPLPVGLVVACTFKAGAEWRPRRLSPGQAVQALFANTVPARRIPETVLTTLRQVVLTAPAVVSERGEAASVVRPILDLAVSHCDLRV